MQLNGYVLCVDTKLTVKAVKYGVREMEEKSLYFKTELRKLSRTTKKKKKLSTHDRKGEKLQTRVVFKAGKRGTQRHFLKNREE